MDSEADVTTVKDGNVKVGHQLINVEDCGFKTHKPIKQQHLRELLHLRNHNNDLIRKSNTNNDEPLPTEAADPESTIQRSHKQKQTRGSLFRELFHLGYHNDSAKAFQTDNNDAPHPAETEDPESIIQRHQQPRRSSFRELSHLKHNHNDPTKTSQRDNNFNPTQINEPEEVLQPHKQRQHFHSSHHPGKFARELFHLRHRNHSHADEPYPTIEIEDDEPPMNQHQNHHHRQHYQQPRRSSFRDLFHFRNHDDHEHRRTQSDSDLERFVNY